MFPAKIFSSEMKYLIEKHNGIFIEHKRSLDFQDAEPAESEGVENNW